MNKIRTVCLMCGRFRNAAGAWEKCEGGANADTLLSHGLCPSCAEDFYAKYLDESSVAVIRSRENAVGLGIAGTH